MALLKECSVSPILMPHGSIDTTIGSMNQSISCSAPITSSPYIVDSLGISRTKWLNRKNSATFRQLLPKIRTIEMSISMTSNLPPFVNKPVLKRLQNSNLFTDMGVSHPLGGICGVRGKAIRGSVGSSSTKSPVGGEGDQEWWQLSDDIEQNLKLSDSYVKKLEVLQQKFGIRSRELLLRALVHESCYNIVVMPHLIAHGDVGLPKSVIGSTLSTENYGENGEKGYEDEILPRDVLDLQIGEEQQLLDTNGDTVLDLAAHRMIRSQLGLLGDSVITATTIDCLIRRHGLALIGILTERRSELVSNKNIGRVGIRNFGLMEIILTEPQFCRQSLEDPSPTFSKQAQVTVVADVVEMLVGAIFVEQGVDCAMTFISTHLLPLLENAIEDGDRPEDVETFVVTNPISALQEFCQKFFGCLPNYEVERVLSDPTMFESQVFVEGVRLGSGLGNSKAKAKREAASGVLEKWRLEDLLY